MPTKIPRAALALVVAAAACPVAAQNAPLFSVENNGPSGLLGDRVFQVVGGVPVQVGGGSGMGLGRAGDDITALAPLVPSLRPANLSVGAGFAFHVSSV